MKYNLLLIPVIIILFVKFSFSQVHILNQNQEYYLQFKVLETQMSIGKYITGNADSLGFVQYNGKATPNKLPVENRMITLRANFTLDSFTVNQDLVIVFPPVFYACQIYLNGNLIAKRGNIVDGYTNHLHRTECYYLLPSLLHDRNEIAIELFPRYGEQNPVNGIFIADRKTGETYTFWRNFFSISFTKSMTIASLVISLYFSIFYFLRKSNRTSYYIPFALACFLYTLSYINNILSFDFANTLWIEKVTRVSVGFWTYSTLIYLLEYTKITKFKNRIIQFLSIPYIVLTYLVLIQNNVFDLLNFFNTIATPVNLMVYLGVLIISIVYFIRKFTFKAFVILALYLVVIVTIFHDMYYFSVLQTKPYAMLLPYAMFLALVVFFFILAWEHSDIYKIAMQKTDELKQINDNLERIIEQRTAKLSESETQFRMTFENSNVGVCLIDFKGNFLKVNNTLCKIYGYSAQELAGMNVKDITVPEDKNISIDFINKALTSNDSATSSNFEKRYFHKSGHIIHCLVSSSLVKANNAEPLYFISHIRDISLEKQQAAQIAAERQQFLSLLNDIPEPVYVSDYNTSEVLFANKAKYNIFGEDIIGRKCYEIFHQLSTRCEFCQCDNLPLSENNIIRWEHYYPTVKKHFYNIDRLITWHDGRLAKFQIAFDLTELRKAEAQIRKLSVAVEQNPATIVITDLIGNIEYANPKFAELTGYTVEEAIGRNPRVLKSGKTDAKVFKDLWKTILAGKIWQGEFINKKKNGDEFIESATIAPILDEQGKIINFIAIKEDVTQKKHQEELINLNNKRLDYLLELSQMKETEMHIILEKALEFTLLLTKSEYGYIYYYNEENKQFILNSWSKDVMHDCKVINPQSVYSLENTGLWGEVVRQRKPIMVNNYLADNPYKKGYPKGHVAITRFLSIPVFNAGEVVAVIGVSNKLDDYDDVDIMQLNLLAESVWSISRQKDDEQKIRKYAEQLKDLNATKDKFFGIIAHDLKNPFNTLLGFSELLILNAAKYTPEKVEQFAKSMNNTAKHAYTLLENLLEWSRLQTGKLAPNFELATPAELIYEVKLLCQPLANAKDIEIEAKGMVAAKIFVDKEMIKTTLRNLITNAIKFTHPNGKITIETKQQDNQVIISVIDTGIGIEEEHINKLFKMDSKLSRTGTADERGTGLGLILCKEFVEKNSGTIWAESEIGLGSRFSLALNLVAD